MRTLAALLPLVLLACAGPAGPVRGPLRHRSQHPLFLTWLDLESRRAVVNPAGRLTAETALTYTSVFQLRGDDTLGITLDGELARLELALRLGLGRGWELFAALPWLYTTSGFLDAPIENTHDLFHLPQDGRRRHPRNRFGVRLRARGREAYALTEDRLGVEDVPVGAAYQLLREGPGRPALLLRGAVELPTGSERHGFGNGRPDAGLGFVLEKSWGRLTLTAGADHAWIRRTAAQRRAGLVLRSLWGAFLAGEVRASRRLSLLAGLDYQANPLRRLPLRETRRPQLLVLLGAAWDLTARSLLRVSLAEDLVPDAAPDVTFGLTWVHRF